MSKYDFQLDLSGSTSTGLILSKIKKGSTVLEFGCATGRMTRYMRDALGCRVYIVEFEEAAFQKAMEYAEDGLCDDIMTFRWRQKFQNVRFDAVVCADVLEHLSDPEAVLRSASELLTEDGSIHISLPNITHNDVLVKAFRERFDYTKVGLLDDSHVHFWGLENLQELAAGSGLHLQSVEATYCRTGETEQKPLLDGVTARFENVLRQRACGEVYQFVVSLSKQPCQAPVFQSKAPTARMHLYLDTGNNFNQNEVLFFEAESDGCGGYIARYQLPQDHGVRRIRLDPVEHQGCILTRMRVFQDGRELPLGYSECVRLDEGVCLLGDDPAVYADIGPGEVALEVRMLLPGAAYEQFLQQQYESMQQQYTGQLQQSQVLQHQLQHQNAQAKAAKQHYEAVISDWKGQFATAKKEIAMLGRELEQVRSDLCGYVILSNKKEEYIIKKEEYIIELEQRNRELDQALRYRNSLRGLLRGLAGWMLRKMKAVAKRILRR